MNARVAMKGYSRSAGQHGWLYDEFKALQGAYRACAIAGGFGGWWFRVIFKGEINECA